MPETVDRRVLGAIRFVDAVTRAAISEPLVVSAPGVSWRRNSSGWFVVAAAPGLHDHTLAFDAPPAIPPVGTLPIELTVRDPGRRYVARRHTFHLPRSADPAGALDPGSLFRPADVPMFRSSSAPVAQGWAVVRATVTAAGSGARLGGALLLVLSTAAPPVVLAAGIADERGEGVVVVPNVPVTTFGEGESVLATEVSVAVQAVVVPGSLDVPDPDAMAAAVGTPEARAVTVANVKLASGRTVVLPLSIALEES
jgi:hypothetical protein